MRRLALALAAALALSFATTALADGEAGIVIDYGDGRVETACIAFSGDGIAGEELLRRVGADVNHFSGLVCSIDDLGCQHSGSFDSCTCECGSGGPCVYWAFFSRAYEDDAWRYSSLGFRALDAKDGDLQAWRWGEGVPGSAPAPALISFEDICGHAPTSLATATVVPMTEAPTPAPSPTPATADATATSAPASPTQGEVPTATVAATAEPSLPASTASPTLLTTEPPPASSPTETATVRAVEPEPKAEDGGGGAGALIAFAATAGGLLVLFGGVLAWRRGWGRRP